MYKIKALYTLSGDTTIYISKRKVYDLLTDKNGQTYLIDNVGERMNINRETLVERFEILDS